MSALVLASVFGLADENLGQNSATIQILAQNSASQANLSTQSPTPQANFAEGEQASLALQANSTGDERENSATKAYELEATTIEAHTHTDTRKYQSGAAVSHQALDAVPNANGDMTSVLKILPNVQFDAAQQSSHTPGEINPANISISGGLFYQNNFQLDGFNINNDLDPISDKNYYLSGG